MEQIAQVVNRYCTFPAIERVKLFERTLFSFLAGNEDMHLKNFSLITDARGRIDLAPAYDFVNSTIALRNPTEELALPIRGKRSRLTRHDLVDYFAGERLEINERVRYEVISRFKSVFPVWDDLLAKSFLSNENKAAYTDVLNRRKAQLGLDSNDAAIQ
jgi:serine/threonine-protein kinase HipA